MEVAQLPDYLLNAGQLYLARAESDDDHDPEQELLLAIESATGDSVAHKRAVWLCRFAVQRVLERGGPPTIGPVKEVLQALGLVDRWLAGVNDLQLVEWARACHVDSWCLGKSCNDYEGGPREYSFMVSELVGRLCRIARNGGILDGAEILQGAMFADARYRERAFQSWLVSVALPAACELRQLNSQELREG